MKSPRPATTAPEAPAQEIKKPEPVLIVAKKYPKVMMEESREDREQMSQVHLQENMTYQNRLQDAIKDLLNVGSIIITPALSIGLALFGGTTSLKIDTAWFTGIIGFLTAMLPILASGKTSDAVSLFSNLSNSQRDRSKDESGRIPFGIPLGYLGEFTYQVSLRLYRYIKRSYVVVVIANTLISLIAIFFLLYSKNEDVAVIVRSILTVGSVTAIISVALYFLRIGDPPFTKKNGSPYHMLAIDEEEGNRVVSCTGWLKPKDKFVKVSVIYNKVSQIRRIVMPGEKIKLEPNEILEEGWELIPKENFSFYPTPLIINYLDERYNLLVETEFEEKQAKQKRDTEKTAPEKNTEK